MKVILIPFQKEWSTPYLLIKRIFISININYKIHSFNSYLKTKDLLDSLIKNCFLIFKNLKLKTLIGNSILQKCFQKYFSVY
jgi:hypothetical protein